MFSLVLFVISVSPQCPPCFSLPFFSFSLSFLYLPLLCFLPMKDANYRFLNWPVYQDSKKLAKLCQCIARKLPSDHRFGLAAQIIRSSTSVSLNIAEGSGKQTDRDLNRYLNIARGSLFETVSSLDLIQELGLSPRQDLLPAMILCRKISDQLSGFKRRLRGW